MHQLSSRRAPPPAVAATPLTRVAPLGAGISVHRDNVDRGTGSRAGGKGAVVGDVAAEPACCDLDGAVVAEDVADVLGAAAGPGCGAGVFALGGLRGKGLVLEVDGEDDVAPVFPDFAAVLALVVEDGGEALVEGTVGLVFFVEVAGAKGLTVNVVSTRVSQPVFQITCPMPYDGVECMLTRWVRSACYHREVR